MNDNNTIGKIKAPSKINLYLKVKGKREDGYHEIESLFVPLDEPSDEITILESLTAGIIIDSDSNNIPLDETNICYKAAMEFAKFANIEPRWNIHIEKNIPVAAGLGGGSSDAAAVLKILNDNVQDIGQEHIAKLAKSIGADVPFFLDPIPSVVTGIGEKLNPVKLETSLDIVLVNPLFPVSAKWAYEKSSKFLNFRFSSKNSRVPSSELGNTGYGVDELIDILNAGGIPDNIVNDLAPAVFEKFPIMGILSDKMKEYGAKCVGMSGSGPTLFGICGDIISVANLAEKIKEEYGSAIWMAESEINH